MGPILQFIRPHDVFDAETLGPYSAMPSTRLSPPFKTTVNDLSFARQWLSAFWTSRRKGSATRIACTEQRLVRLVLDYRCRVRSGADVAFTGRSSFGSMHPTLMMKFFAQLLSR